MNRIKSIQTVFQMIMAITIGAVLLHLMGMSRTLLSFVCIAIMAFYLFKALALGILQLPAKIIDRVFFRLANFIGDRITRILGSLFRPRRFRRQRHSEGIFSKISYKIIDLKNWLQGYRYRPFAFRQRRLPLNGTSQFHDWLSNLKKSLQKRWYRH